MRGCSSEVVVGVGGAVLRGAWLMMVRVPRAAGKQERGGSGGDGEARSATGCVCGVARAGLMMVRFPRGGCGEGCGRSGAADTHSTTIGG